MQRIQTARLVLIVLLTSGLVAAGYEIRSAGLSFSGIPPYVIAGLSVFLGGAFATLCVNILLGFRRIRSVITNTAHVEGYWYLTTDSQSNGPLSPEGVLFISHEPSLGETRLVTTRLDPNGGEYTTASEIAYVRGEGIDMKYLNYFRLMYPGPESPFGLSAGRFIWSDDLKPYPDKLEAHINLTGENVVRRQSARRIDDKRVRQFMQKYGANWKTEVLTKGKQHVFGEDPV